MALVRGKFLKGLLRRNPKLKFAVVSRALLRSDSESSSPTTFTISSAEEHFEYWEKFWDFEDLLAEELAMQEAVSEQPFLLDDSGAIVID